MHEFVDPAPNVPPRPTIRFGLDPADSNQMSYLLIPDHSKSPGFNKLYIFCQSLGDIIG